MRNIFQFYLYIFFVCLLFSAQSFAYDKPYVGEQIEYSALYEDTFVYLARDYNLGFVEMRAANPDIDPWIPGEGTKLILPTRHLIPDASRKGIIINLPEMRLYKFQGEKPPMTFPIGIGREGLDTPLGETSIVRKKAGPSWRPTARMRKEDPTLPEVIEPGPDNPLGTHALYLGWPTYAIHGTNRPFGIGRRISSGCIRLYPEDIVKLFDNVPTGTPVVVVDQPIKAAWIDDELYVEAHPNIEQAIQMEEEGMVVYPSLDDKDFDRIIEVAGEHKDRLNWPLIRKVVLERRGYPVKVGTRPRTQSAKESLEEIYDSEKETETVDSASTETENGAEENTTAEKEIETMDSDEIQAEEASIKTGLNLNN